MHILKKETINYIDDLQRIYYDYNSIFRPSKNLQKIDLSESSPHGFVKMFDVPFVKLRFKRPNWTKHGPS